MGKQTLKTVWFSLKPVDEIVFVFPSDSAKINFFIGSSDDKRKKKT